MVRLLMLNAAAALVVAGLVALCVWQVQRRAWKADLIARVEARVGAAAVPAPPADAAVGLADEYRRVTASGTWLADRTVLVRAVTKLGGGSWAMTPLLRPDGTAVLVNRGFVPADATDPARMARRDGPVTGLLRLSEPGGTPFQANDPAENRWVSRDVAAIAAARGLPRTAAYFIDAEAAPGDTGLPVAGLTVLTFANSHLVYALTWAALALMTAAAAAYVNVEALRRRRS